MASLSIVESLLKTLEPPKNVQSFDSEEKKQHKHHSHDKHHGHHHGHHGHKKNKKKDEFNPQTFWCGENNEIKPYLFVSPMRYVMGDGVFDQMARYLTLVPSTNPGIIITKQGLNRFGQRLKTIFAAHSNINVKYLLFEGQCLFKGADQIMHFVKNNAYKHIDCILGIGGGKIIDVSKLVAKNLNVPMISMPTIASNEASCSALSIIHCSRRGFRGLLSYKSSPLLVVVDSGIICKAPLQYFVAGIGDAMATFYETSICNTNANAANSLGGKICLATLAMAQICKDTLMAYALAACLNIENGGKVSNELEKCIEANTLLSGIGFESGGIALAHAIAHSMTVGARKHKQYMHGEEVAVGLLTQLAFEHNMDELVKVAVLFCKVGLPVSYKQLKLDIFNENDELNSIFEVLFGDRLEFRNNEIGDVNKETVVNAMCRAEKCVEPILNDVGQQRFSRFHANIDDI